MAVLLLLFAGSGCAALIYELVWFQLLQLMIGSSAISLSVLLCVYMGGLCLGSVALRRVAPVRQHPIRLYGWLELGIGALGILVLVALPVVGRIYIAGATPGVLGIFLRGFVAALCLLPPTILMGATLPAMAPEHARPDRSSHPRRCQDWPRAFRQIFLAAGRLVFHVFRRASGFGPRHAFGQAPLAVHIAYSVGEASIWRRLAGEARETWRRGLLPSGREGHHPS